MNIRISRVVPIAMVIAGVTLLASAQPTKPSTPAYLSPAETVERLFEAANAGRVDRIAELLARFPNVPQEAIAESCSGIAEWLADAPPPIVVAHLRLGNTAVVIFEDSPPKERVDLDPAYLLRREGTWHVLPGLTQFESRFFDLSEDTLGDFHSLEKWFRSQKQELGTLARAAAS